MAGYDLTVRTKKDLVDAIEEFGFLPLFANRVPGFSIEEHVDPIAWFSSGEDGVWEWKGPVIRETGCAYGKFFEKKAVFISREWFYDFANYRRDGYDYDARYDDGLASYHDKRLYDMLSAHAPILSRDLKYLGDYRKGGVKGFDAAIARLQEQCYALISDFVYQLDKYGARYGWGVAEYSTPESFMGPDFGGRAYSREPEESYGRIMEHLRSLFPDTDERALKKLLR